MTDPNEPMPEYGTEAYDRWYRARFGPVALTQPPPKQGHRGRTIFLSCVAAAVVIGGIGAAAGGSHHHKTAAVASSAPAGDSIAQDPTTPSGDSKVDQTPTDTPTSGADPSAINVAIGSTVNITSSEDSALNVDVKVNSVASHLYPADWDPTFMDSSNRPKNGRFLTINVTVAVQGGSYDYNEWDFGVQEADGTAYSVMDGNATSGDFEPSLSSGTLHAGQKIRGNVTFDVPLTKGAVVTLSNGGELLGSWK